MKKKEHLKEIQKIFSNGVQLQKIVRGSSTTFFGSYIPPVYDEKTAYSWKDLVDATKNGWRFKDVNLFFFLLSQAEMFALESITGEEIK